MFFCSEILSVICLSLNLLIIWIPSIASCDRSVLTTLEFNISPLIDNVGIMASTFSSVMAVAASSHPFNAKTVWGG